MADLCWIDLLKESMSNIAKLVSDNVVLPNHSLALLVVTTKQAESILTISAASKKIYILLHRYH